MTIAFKPTATETTIEQNGSAIATLDSNGLTMAAGKTIVGSGVGKILQVVSTTKTDTFSTTSTSFADITGLTVSITPTSSSSKILVIVSISLGNNGTTGSILRLLRDSTLINSGDVASNRPLGYAYVGADSQYNIHTYSSNYLDSPATTSTITYKTQTHTTSGNPVYVNRTSADRDTTTYDGRGASTITVMEVAG